jgi:hypothetical protein
VLEVACGQSGSGALILRFFCARNIAADPAMRARAQPAVTGRDGLPGANRGDHDRSGANHRRAQAPHPTLHVQLAEVGLE